MILAVSYANFWDKLENSEESWRCTDYTLNYGLPEPKLINYSEFLSKDPIRNTGKLFGYLFKGENAVYCSSLGWGTNFTSKNAMDLQSTGSYIAKKHTVEDLTSATNRALYTENRAVLYKIAEWCAKRNIRLVLYTPPAYHTYRDLIYPEQLSMMRKTVKEITNTYSDCTYADFLDDKRFVPVDFHDADHLSDIGAEKLSRIVDSLCSR